MIIGKVIAVSFYQEGIHLVSIQLEPDGNCGKAVFAAAQQEGILTHEEKNELKDMYFTPLCEYLENDKGWSVAVKTANIELNG